MRSAHQLQLEFPRIFRINADNADAYAQSAVFLINVWMEPVSLFKLIEMNADWEHLEKREKDTGCGKNWRLTELSKRKKTLMPFILVLRSGPDSPRNSASPTRKSRHGFRTGGRIGYRRATLRSPPPPIWFVLKNAFVFHVAPPLSCIERCIK